MKKVYLLLAGLLGLHLILLFNLRFTAWPEMISYPYLRNNGYLLYKDMIHPYTPLLTMGLSFLYKIFDYRLEVLKIVTWLFILVNDVLIFLIVNKLTKKAIFAFSALIFYIVTQPFLEGNQFWFDLAIVPFILAGIYFLINGETKRNLFISGILIGLATFIKQTAGLYIVFSILYLAIKHKNLRPLFYFSVGPLVIFLTLVARLISENALRDFFEWTLINPLLTWSRFPGYVQMTLSNRQWLTLGILTVPLVLLIFKSKAIVKEKNFALLILFLVSSSLLVYPRFSFFHFQISIAFLAIAYGYLIKRVNLHLLLLASYSLLIILFIVSPVIRLEWGKETRFWSESDLKLSKKVREATRETPSVYLLGPPSSLYVFSQKLPPKRWGDNFGWYYVSSGVEEEIISRWEKDPARYIVRQDPAEGNWYDLGVYQPPLISDWIKENYTRVQELEPGIWLWKLVLSE